MTDGSPRVSHVFFEAGGVLVDRARFSEQYAGNLARIMTERFGLTAEQWQTAYHHVLADWDSYYADLNLSGDDGMADLREGMFRTTRALFRLAEAPEPDKPTLTTLAQALPALASRGHDAFYPDAPDTLERLNRAGVVAGIVSYMTEAQLEAILEPVRHQLRGVVWGADNAEHFDKDAQRYTLAAARAGVAPEGCLVVDTQLWALEHAAQAGMQTLQVARGAALPGALPNLRGVLDYCGISRGEE